MEDTKDTTLSVICMLGWVIVIILVIFLLIFPNYILSVVTGVLLLSTIIIQIVLSRYRKSKLGKLYREYIEIKNRYDELYNQIMQSDSELKTKDNLRPVRIKIEVGDIWTGKNYTDMINQVLGTNLTEYNKSTVKISDGRTWRNAWFVFMDGTTHGNNEKYLWQNRISEDGTTIVERCVSDVKAYARSIAPCSNEVFAFQLDPNGENDKCCCKFVGKFEMVDNDEENMIRIYRKTADSFTLDTVKTSIKEQ